MSGPRPNILAIQTYGNIRNPLDMSPGAVGSRGRALEAIRLVTSGQISTDGLIAVFPQGVSKEDPLGIKSDDESLGKQVAKFLASRPEMHGTKIYHEPLGWGTMSHVQNTYKMVRGLGYTSAHIIFVSDPVHIRRVKLVWKWTRPTGWSAEFHGSRLHTMSWAERRIREPIARLVYRFRLSNLDNPIQISVPE